MRFVWQCVECSKIFTDKNECEVHEFECRPYLHGLEKLLNDVTDKLVEDFKLRLTTRNIKVFLYNTEIEDDPYTEYTFNYNIAGKTASGNNFSTDAHNWRYMPINIDILNDEPTFDVIYNLIADHVINPVSPTIYEGVIKDNGNDYTSGYEIDGIDLCDIGYRLKGRKVKIEVIE